jgi:hypothetical protein
MSQASYDEIKKSTRQRRAQPGVVKNKYDGAASRPRSPQTPHPSGSIPTLGTQASSESAQQING